MSALAPLRADELAAELAAYVKPPACVLDVGCGDGQLLALLLQQGYVTLGCDSDAQRLARARQLCPGAELELARAEQLPFITASCDAVLLSCVFSLTEPRRCSREIARVLRPNGRVLVWDLCAEQESVLPGGLHVHSRDSLAACFADAGLRWSGYFDRTPALRQYVGQLLLDGAKEQCSWTELRPLRPGYGLWVFCQEER